MFVSSVFCVEKNVLARELGPAIHELLGVSGIPQNSMDLKDADPTWGLVGIRFRKRALALGCLILGFRSSGQTPMHGIGVSD